MLIQEKIKLLQPFKFNNENIHGHVCIDLHNTKSGFTERIEGNNLVTNAVENILNMAAAGGNNPPYNLLPIATNLLGGLMIFDSNLQANKNNCEFPGQAHFIGCAGDETITNSIYKGERNTKESKEIPNGYQTVWDFGTSQANGQIGSLARTSVANGNNLRTTSALTPITQITEISSYNQPCVGFDENFKYYSSDGSVWQFPKPKISAYEIVSPQKLSETYSALSPSNTGFFFEGEINNNLRYSKGSLTNTTDNFIREYNIATHTFTTLDRTINGVSWNYSSSVLNNTMYACITENSINKLVKAPISNLTNITVLEENFRGHICKIGHALITDYDNQTSNRLIYTDGTIISLDFYHPGDIAGRGKILFNNTGYEGETYEWTSWGRGTWDSAYIKIADGFLGTIFNLPEAITKTANQTMKITYTLTNV